MDRCEGHVVYEFADFRVDATQRLLQLKVDGRALPLTSRAFDALLYFTQHRGQLLDKSTLMAAIWPNTIVEENNLNQQISLLRRVLGEAPGDHRFIVTIPGQGYRFVADVLGPSNVPHAVVQADRVRAEEAAPDARGNRCCDRAGQTLVGAPPHQQLTPLKFRCRAAFAHLNPRKSV
jgi:DNA-binding winged helix-turn-helix (wHTH) protein